MQTRLPAGKTTATKEMISIRLERKVLAAWRATGKGWQTRLAVRIAQLTPQPEAR